ncbi:MAG: hypothetical protein Q7R93_04375 [bacterium]|nr:hypothetical protein [bacterium]
MFIKPKGVVSVTLSVICSVLFITIVAEGATTISTNISTGGSLTVTGATTLSTLSLTYASSTAISSTGGAWFGTSGGNVGIGTVSPDSIFEVTGTEASNPYITVESSDGGGDKAILGDLGSSNDGVLQLFSSAGVENTRLRGSASDNSWINANGGNVGIGTTSPFAKLSVHGFANATYANTLFAVASSTASATTTHFVIMAGGNVGIGTTSPVSKLSVAGFINTDEFSGYKQNGATILVGSTTAQSIYVGENSGQNAAHWTNGTDNSQNTALGFEAMKNITKGPFNTAVGFRAMYTASSTSGEEAAYNTAIGYQSLPLMTTGSDNTAVGAFSLGRTTTGYWNAAFGENALYNNTTGHSNSAFGAITTMNSNTTGYENTAIGNNALRLNTTGFHNIALGFRAGENLITGSNNIIIGYNIDATSTDSVGGLNIGNLLFGNGIDGTDGSLSSGSIGVGTTTPAKKLGVAGDGFFSSAATTTLYIHSTGTNKGGCIELTAANGTTKFRAYATTTGPLLLELGNCQ